MTGKKRRLRAFFTFATLFLGLVTMTSMFHLAHAAGTLYVSPSGQGPFSKGTLVTYQVKVSAMDAFNYWDVYIQSDASVLDPQSITIRGNTLDANFSASMTELTNCVDGAGSTCGQNDGGGIAHSAAVSLNPGSIKGPVSGLLFNITYLVTASSLANYSQLSIFTASQLLYGSTTVSYTPVGAIYGIQPTLPKADFTWSPAAIYTGHSVNFTATANDTNPGAKITSYQWQFVDQGNGHVLECAGQSICLSSSANFTRDFCLSPCPSPISIGFSGLDNVTVTLTVVDSLGISSLPVSHLLTVIINPRVFPVVALTASISDNILPGTIVGITVSVSNDGNTPITGVNLTLYFGQKIMHSYPIRDLQRSHTVSFDSTVDTSGFKTDVYELVASLPPLPGETETDLRSNNATLELRIIYPNPGGTSASIIPLSIPEFSGVVIAALVAIGALQTASSRVRQRKRRQEEELE